MRAPTLHVATPTYRPYGGVVKILDYVAHARALGYEVSLWCKEERNPDGALFRSERYRPLMDDPGVRWHSNARWDIRAEDLCFVSQPTDFRTALGSLPRGYSPARIIHIIQNVRHVNPTWLDGVALRLLTRPAARISINQIVADTIAPYLDVHSPHTVIPLGHEFSYFARERSGDLGAPIRVASTAWKSDVGARVAERLDDRFEVRVLTEHADWSELRELYHWADVFLSAPLREEGLYLPGVEAMAAGCLVVTPDSGGNMAYCRPDENCLLVGYEDVGGYVDALDTIATATSDRIAALRASGYAAVEPFSLEQERKGFGRYLDELWAFINENER